MALLMRLGKILFFYLQAASLHITGFAAQECTVAINQEPFIEGRLNRNMTISCNFTSFSCKGKAKVLWFRINTNKTINLCSGACSNTVTNGRFTLSDPRDIASLRIQQVTQNDSGMYYCGIAFQGSSFAKSKQTGNGTMVVVTGDMGSDLWLQSTLIIILSLYTICITFLLVQTIRSMKKANSAHNQDSNIPNEEQKSQVCKDLAMEFNRKYRNNNQQTTLQEVQSHCAETDNTIYQNA
ncbi:immunoglobulin superfamily member 6-like [Scyliorhinus canicula]|uniref:immunoglobulin superfamily member 6-like n=1 Tax=Scyliorhinus canicula TaxID=7830 RepID=UPI0018F2E441|nr:immunoglobulin superfamily member 6-like [Scyliorhinus canicula]